MEQEQILKLPTSIVMPFIHDSRKGIAVHRQEVMEIMSRGGGVGTNGSTLRPKSRGPRCQWSVFWGSFLVE